MEYLWRRYFHVQFTLIDVCFLEWYFLWNILHRIKRFLHNCLKFSSVCLHCVMYSAHVHLLLVKHSFFKNIKSLKRLEYSAKLEQNCRTIPMVVWYSGPIILPNSPETQMAVHFAYVHEHSLSRIKAISSLCCLICLMCWGKQGVEGGIWNWMKEEFNLNHEFEEVFLKYEVTLVISMIC